jgi:phage shock protein C
MVRVVLRAVTEVAVTLARHRGDMTQTGAAQAPYKQLRRPNTDRMIAGVASGLGRYFNLDPTLIRVIFAVTAVMTGGLALLAYPVMWFVMPEEPAGAPAWPHPAASGPSWHRPTAPPATWPGAAEGTSPINRPQA